MSSTLAFLLMPLVASGIEAAVDKFLLPRIALLGIKTEGRFIAASAFVFAFALVAALLAFDYSTLHDLYPELAAGATLIGGGIGVVRGSNQWDRIQGGVVKDVTDALTTVDSTRLKNEGTKDH